MSNVSRPAPSRGKVLLTSFLIALCAGVAYVVVTLFSGFDPLWTPIGAAGVVIVLTAIFFAVNWRRAKQDAAASSER
ncbi:hypothetical protein ACTU3I_08610 [Microbacterium sp. RD1]|uniref:hypothetical protein n=1 Tax=Microbacterium sp. RD1 TaxID=3457313 RepID=UPI003FA53ED2